MNFPSISFFYKIETFYTNYRLIFLRNYYFKLHNILFTNLYIRIYRYKLIRLEKKKKKVNIQNKYKKINRDLFLDKIKKKKRGFFRRKINMTVDSTNKRIKRNYSTTNNLSIAYNENKSNKKNWNYNKQRPRKKRTYVYINKFKDCGNQYNFDPFYPHSTYKLNDFNFYRTKKIKKKPFITTKKKIDLSIFDPRLANINFKFFNNYIFSLLLQVYKNQKLKKSNFLFILKNNVVFFYNFLRFLKKRIFYIKMIIFNLRKSLRSFIYKLNLFSSSLKMNKNELISFLSYLKSRNVYFFKLYAKLIRVYNRCKTRLESLSSVYNKYLNYYNSFLISFKKKYANSTRTQTNKTKIISHFKKVNDYEKLHTNILSKFAEKMRFFKIKNMQKWERKKTRNNVYISMNKYITLYRSLFKFNYLNKHASNKAIIYIKATITNVFIYFIYNNKLLYKKSCGELRDVKKKERRFWRNIYPLVEKILPFLVKMKAKYKFPFVSLYLNGSSSLCTPLISRIRKHNKKFRRIIYFLFNEMDFFYNKTLEIKDKYRHHYKFYPIYRLKLYSILDGFNRLSKIFFAINKVKDITSWPYNGCKRKKKKNVR